MNGEYRPGGFQILPAVVKNLLIINTLMFILQLIAPTILRFNIEDQLGLHYFESQMFKPWQFITYMFLHGNFTHIFFNMFALWMFGYALENVWGPKRFLVYYLLTGIGAGIFHYVIFFFEINPVMSQISSFVNDPSTAGLMEFISSHQFKISEYSGAIWKEFQNFEGTVTYLQSFPDDRKALQDAVNFMVDYREYFLNLPNVIGASGAVFGILLAFGLMFPNTRIYIYFLLPIKAKYFVLIYGAIELYLGFSQAGSSVAHFAHLGGMLFGYLLIRYWKSRGLLY